MVVHISINFVDVLFCVNGFVFVYLLVLPLIALDNCFRLDLFLVQLFDKAIKMALDHKENGGDFISDVADFLHEPSPLDKPDQ